MRAVLLSIFLAALVSLVAIPPLASALTFNRPLAYGSSGTDVSVLQQYLKDQGYFHYPDTTGYFGSYTWRALAAFQWDNKLEAVGYLGPKTELALNQLLGQSLASLASSTLAAPAAPTATSTISLVPTPPPAPIYTTPPPTPAIGQPWHAPSGGSYAGGPPAPAPEPAPTPPPAPASYVAQAVHFDGQTFLGRLYGGGLPSPGDPLLPNSSTGIFAVWFYMPALATNSAQLFSQYGNSFFNGGNSMSNMSIYSGGGADINFELYPGQYASGDNNNRHFTPTGWHLFLASWNTNYPQYEKILPLYIDGVTPTYGDRVADGADTTSATQVQWSYYAGSSSDTVSIAIPDISTGGEFPGPTLDMADLQFWDGVSADLSDPTVVAKFISGGKPVDPAVAAAAFGKQTILFSGDASTFVTNQGTGGAFALTTSFTATGLGAAGSVTLTGSKIGQTVRQVWDITGNADVSSDFETTISVNDQIQQTAGSLSGHSLTLVLSGNPLTDANTSPSN
jgi:peptidoglycan hydrolase-like protein with peptidoglycan-binding domain